MGRITIKKTKVPYFSYFRVSPSGVSSSRRFRLWIRAYTGYVTTYDVRVVPVYRGESLQYQGHIYQDKLRS